MGTNLMPPSSTTGGQSTVDPSVAGGDEVPAQLESPVAEKRDVSGSTTVGQEVGVVPGEYSRQ